MIMNILCITTMFLSLSISTTKAQSNSTSLLKKYQGIYRDDVGQKYFLNPSDGFPHFAVMETGETHMLRLNENKEYEFSSTRNSWNEIGGTISFSDDSNKKQICIKYGMELPVCAYALPIMTNEVSLSLGDSIEISGMLMRPLEPKSDLVAVLLHGDGENDRYDLFDIGTYLLDGGHSVFAFDKRNAGYSKGPQVDGNSYDEISRVYADDAIKIISRLKTSYPDERFGVVGISQGGWIGSIVSAQIPDLAFYVNIAGSVSIGWQQWQHYMVSYLKRNKFTETDIAEAEDYFETFFAVGLNQASFEEYESTLKQYEQKDWFHRLKKRKLVRWKDKKSAQRVVENNLNDPSTDVMKVNAPTLGIFYEFDHSTPPDSPLRFITSLLESHSSDHSIRVFPKSTHGGWVVDSYYFDTSKITRFESKAYQFLINWLNSL